MALYQFSCKKHGDFDVSQPMQSDHESESCPACGMSCRRVLTPAQVIYKTGGFYHVDSGKRFESQLSERGKRVYQEAKRKAGV